MTVAILDREVYVLSEAARLLQMPPQTLFWWLDGGDRRGKTYRPVIRVEPTGSRTLTWAEFVEARYLRAYRRQHDVPLPELRVLIDELRQSFGVPYPLAHFKPLVVGREAVLKLQESAHLPPEWWLFVKAGGQILATPASEDFLEHVEFNDDPEDGWVRRIYPRGLPRHDESSAVVFDPAVSFGSPSLRGIRTAVLAELIDAGEPVEDVAESYGLTEQEVRAAVSYEWSAA